MRVFETVLGSCGVENARCIYNLHGRRKLTSREFTKACIPDLVNNEWTPLPERVAPPSKASRGASSDMEACAGVNFDTKAHYPIPSGQSRCHTCGIKTRCTCVCGVRLCVKGKDCFTQHVVAMMVAAVPPHATSGEEV